MESHHCTYIRVVTCILSVLIAPPHQANSERLTHGAYFGGATLQRSKLPELDKFYNIFVIPPDIERVEGVAEDVTSQLQAMSTTGMNSR